MSADRTDDKPGADRGMVHVYTGDGKGKTTTALGLALRAMGRGRRVYFCQFMKGRPTGELAALERFSKQIKIERFGRAGFVYPGKIDEEDRRLAAEGFASASKKVLSGDYDLAVLDEIGPACSLGLIDPAVVVELIRERPEAVELILTGRDMPDEIIEIADLVTEMVEVKHYYRQGRPPREGIEY